MAWSTVPQGDVRYNTDTNEITDIKAAIEKNRADREAQLLHGDTDKYGIYQLKDDPGLRDFHFAGTAELLKRGILSDDFREIQPGNYNLVYAGELSDIYGQSQMEKLNAIYEKCNIDHPADYRGHSLSVSDIVVLHEDGENSAHFVDSYGFTKLPEFMRALEGVKEQDTQKAEPEEKKETSGHDVQNPEAEQTEQKTCPDFYGHTLRYAADHGEVDRYMESHKFDRECKEAIEGTIRQNFDGMYLNHDIVKPLAEKYGAERMAFILANTIQQESWDGRFSRDNKAWASEFSIPENLVHGIDMNRELIVSSHPAVLDGFIGMFRREVLEQEKEMSAEQDIQKPEAEQPEPEQTKEEQAETERLKPQAEQSGQEKSARAPESEDLDEGDEIIDLGDEKDKVLAEMKQSLEGGQETSGHDVQKPEQAETELAFQIADRYISVQETEGGYAYSVMDLDYKELYEDIQKETKESLFPEQAEPEAMQTEPEVTLTVAECGEFHNLGEFYENIPTVEEAVAIWKQIPPERMNGIPAIGVNIHTPGTEAFEDVGIDILTGKRIDLDILEYIPDIKGNPQAMEVIAELVAKLPEMEIDGRMSEEFEAKVWEKRMPDLTPAEQFAVEIDRFVYDYDTALYRDNSQSMTVNVSEIAEALNQRDTHDIALWLVDVLTEGTEPEKEKAMEILKKLTEYKPLAKVEEMEEQNYNMVDNVLNNGAGEKAQKEENKREQERPAARTSLKARLAEKKALVSGQRKDHDAQENAKNNQREM